MTEFVFKNNNSVTNVEADIKKVSDKLYAEQKKNENLVKE